MDDKYVKLLKEKCQIPYFETKNDQYPNLRI